MHVLSPPGLLLAYPWGSRGIPCVSVCICVHMHIYAGRTVAKRVVRSRISFCVSVCVLALLCVLVLAH